jgi:3-oxoacyl-[acyl-carrier protein] reductase
MLLEDRIAIVYGGGGAIGAAVARGFAREGARVYLAGRNIAALDATARSIRAAGGIAEPAIVDALDVAAVESHAAAVVRQSGRVDIVFNAISNDDLQGIPLVDIDYADFILPITKSMTAHFNISTVAARHMLARGRGVILAMGGGREAVPNLGGAHVAWAALAGLCRQLAAELGPSGIRVAWLLSPGSPDARQYGAATGTEEVNPPDVRPDDPFASATLLNRRPTYDDVANVAVFLASDWAATMTATEVNITGGAVVD